VWKVRGEERRDEKALLRGEHGIMWLLYIISAREWMSV
jgi:hypothetical protein